MRSTLRLNGSIHDVARREASFHLLRATVTYTIVSRAEKRVPLQKVPGMVSQRLAFLSIAGLHARRPMIWVICRNCPPFQCHQAPKQPSTRLRTSERFSTRACHSRCIQTLACFRTKATSAAHPESHSDHFQCLEVHRSWIM